MFFKLLAQCIFKYRKLLLFLVCISFAYSLFFAVKVQPAHEAKLVLPSSDSSVIRYHQFIKNFGEDDNSIVVGTQGMSIFEPRFLTAWKKLSDSIKTTKNVKEIISITHFFDIHKDSENKKFILSTYQSPQTFDATSAQNLKDVITKRPFYKDLIWDKSGKTTLINVVLSKGIGKSKDRDPIIKAIEKYAKVCSDELGQKVYISGMPYVRTEVGVFVLNEFLLFLGLTMVLAFLVLLLLYHNLFSILFPILSVVMGVSFSLAYTYGFGYNLTLLTGLVPPLIVIIGIPNSILIINKYRKEWQKHKTRELTLKNTLHSCVFSTFLANFTTAVGFFVFYFTGSALLEEFGLVASLSVMTTWLVSIILIPTMYDMVYEHKLFNSSKKNFYTYPFLDKGLEFVNSLSEQRKKQNLIFLVIAVLTLLSVVGMLRLRADSKVVDDLSKGNPILTNLNFFENNFNGIVPLEIVVNSGKKKGFEQLSNLRKLERFEKAVEKLPAVSRSLSLNHAFKFITQSFYNDSPAFYRLPQGMEKNFILPYLQKSNTNSPLLRNYVDSVGQSTRVSFRMRDVGSHQNAILFKKIDSIGTKYFKAGNVHITGVGELSFSGTKYLIHNLSDSLLLAIIIIAGLMWSFFRDYRMIFIATLPNLIPLCITAGIMGFAGIEIKPSTILIFSIALGIASDQTIYFLSKLKHYKNQTSNDVHVVIKEVGVSTAYITTLLLLGFSIFMFSDFKGTVYLGLLLSLTLASTFFSNILFLPALIRRFNIKVH